MTSPRPSRSGNSTHWFIFPSNQSWVAYRFRRQYGTKGANVLGRRSATMRVDRKWVERNLGFDPIATPPPDATFASVRAAKAETPEDFQREIIDFDSESPAGPQFMACRPAS